MPLKAQLHNGDKGGWDEYVRSHPEASNYHQLGWRKVIERSFNHRTYYLSARTRGGDLQGVLPLVYMKSGLFGRFLVSVPFVNYGGLLSNSPEASSVLLDEAQAILQGLAADHLELRHVGNTMENLITRQHKVTMILSLEKNEDDQWKKFNAKLRNQIRKAIKSDLYFKSGHEELLNSFYDVFARNMRDLGTPVYT